MWFSKINELISQGSKVTSDNIKAYELDVKTFPKCLTAQGSTKKLRNKKIAYIHRNNTMHDKYTQYNSASI